MGNVFCDLFAFARDAEGTGLHFASPDEGEFAVLHANYGKVAKCAAVGADDEDAPPTCTEPAGTDP